MIRTDVELSETDIRSPGAQTHAVRGSARIRRPWLKGEPSCPLLTHYQILHLGWAVMPAPFQIVRTKLGGSYFLATVTGEGWVRVDGRFKRCGPEQAFLLQPGTMHAFHATPGTVWTFCWVRFQEEQGQQPLATVHSPALADYDPHPLHLAIQGLYHECRHDNVAVEVERWIDLVHGYVRRFAEPRQMDERIWQLWEHVARDLAYPWTSRELARQVHLSEKQLERLCRRELGRTPRQHLIWMRMRRAAELLADEDRKVASVAHEVGYENPFVFSTTYKRTIGWSPSEHTARLRKARR